MIDLNEIDQKVLKQDTKEVLYRFLQDINHKVNLFLWQDQAHLGNGNFGIQKFQFSYRDHILEWKINGALKYGMVDDGENPHGIKRSPVMMLTNEINKKAYEFLLWYIDEIQIENMPEKTFLKKVFYESEAMVIGK